MSRPPHLRPPVASRANSAQSLASARSGSSRNSHRPHPQHREYVPSGMSASVIGGTVADDGVTERWMLDEAEAARSDTSSILDPDDVHVHQDHEAGEADEEQGIVHARGKNSHHASFNPDVDSRSAEYDPREDGEEGEEQPNWDWDNLRDGSISRRPPWRRPTPKWILPFILGATISLGMTMAPKAELLIDLACLAHPPQQSSSLTAPHNEWAEVDQPWKGQRQGQGVLAFSDSNTNSSISIPKEGLEGPQSGKGKTDDGLSPADKWFLRLQHQIYEYKVHHHLINVTTPSEGGNSDGSTQVPMDPSTPSPSSPVETATPANPTAAPTTTLVPAPSGTPGSPAPSSPGRAKGPYDEIDPRLCKKDPKVQAAAAKITMIMISTMGILSAISTGFWGQTSDRVGRRRILATVECGLLLADTFFLLVASFPYLAPGGYYSLLIGPFFEGLLGGISTITATAHAYVSDVTPDGSRATAFARLSGALMIGFAMGPVLGSSLIQATNNIMTPFYVSICIHAIWIPLILFLLPESLSSEARTILTKNAEIARAAAKRRDEREREWENTHYSLLQTPAQPTTDDEDDEGTAPDAGGSSWSRLSVGVGRSRTTKRAAGRVRRLFRRVFAFLHPLTVFWPHEKEDGTREWNLTRMGGVMVAMSMMYGIMSTKTQYAFYAFGWTSAEVGPYMSYMSVCRGTVLLVIMPIVMYFVKPYFTEPTIVETTTPTTASTSADPAAPDADTKPAKPKRSAALDLVVLRTCMFIEFTFYGIIALSTKPSSFVILSGILTLGSPGSPAANSLALSFLPSSREAGRLFGGLAVIHAIGATLLSPILFGTLFAYTVGWYAAAVFALASATVGIGFLVALTVRVPKAEDAVKEAERGRGRAVKQVRSSSRIRS